LGVDVSEERVECPVKLLERLKPVQEQLDRLNGELQAALFGARLALGVPDDWQWDMSGWRAPEQESPPVTTAG
jgi:hypothetical protein